MEFKASTPCQKLELPESRLRSAISALDHGCIMPIPSLQLQKKPVICREAEGVVTELWSKELLQFSDCAVSCALRPLQSSEHFEIEILATVSWTCGCQPLSCRCLQNVMYCRKEMCWTCLSKESIPTIHLWNSKHPTCQKLEVPESRSTFRHLCIKWWHHAHPFVAAPEKDCVMQRSRGFGHEVVSKELLQYSDCALSCAL